MNLEELKQKIKDFDKQAGFDKTKFSKLISMLKEELKILENNESDKSIVDHQLTDILILIMQLANRYDTDFDKELSIWLEKSKKYLS